MKHAIDRIRRTESGASTLEIVGLTAFVLSLLALVPFFRETFISFLGIWAWAWSKKRQPTFREMSRLPLEEDDGQVPESDRKKEGTKE